MSHLDPKRPASASELRKFALLVGGAFVVFGAIAYLRHRPPGFFGTLGGIGGALLAVGLIAPRALRPVYTGWMRLAAVLSLVTTPIFMAVIYYVVFTPGGLILRLFGWRPLGRRGEATYWTTRPVGDRASSLEHQF